MSLSARFIHLFKQIIIYVVMVSLQLGTLAQSTQAYAQLAQPANSSANVVAESNAYATSLAFNVAPKFTVAEAQRKANAIDLSQVNPNELFGQGFDLFQYNPALRPNGEAENVLLAKLQNGELTVGSPEYLEATQIAQQRLRDAYSISLVPPEPKKIPKWKMIAGVVVGAVLTFVTAGAAAPFIASALTGVSVAAASAALTAGFFAGTMLGAAITAIAGIAGAYVGAVISAGITTGSFSQALRAGEKALVSGSVKAIVSTIVASAFGLVGLSGLDGIDGSLSNVAMNTLSGGITQTILNGGSFADNLKTAAVNSVVDEIAKGAANTIGDAFPNLDGTNLANYAAHGVLGCASAAAKGADCAAGAIGAMTGEAAAASGFLDAAANSTIGRTLNKDEIVFFGGLVGGTTAAIASKAEDVNANFATGTATASNAVANNYLNHTQAARLQTLQAKFNEGSLTPEETNERNDIIQKDKETNEKRLACTNSTTTECQAIRADFAKAEKSFLPTQLRIENWANEQAANGSPYTAAQLIDAYNVSFTKGAQPPAQTTGGDLYPAADWIREKLAGKPDIFDPIYMGWATANAPSVAGSIGSLIVVNQAATRIGGLAGGALGTSGGTTSTVGNPIPASSVNAAVGLRNDLARQAGVPTTTSDVWGASLNDLKQAFSTGGATITSGSARASSSGNSQILNIEGSSTGVVQVQLSPASTQSSHGGQYYKFTYSNGAELKIIDPSTYRVLGWPENGGRTTFTNPRGKAITYDPVSKTWR